MDIFDLPIDDIELKFCKVTADEDLMHYKTLGELLGDFYPGNYDPTKDQAKQLIKAAVLSAFRWVELHEPLYEEQNETNN